MAQRRSLLDRLASAFVTEHRLPDGTVLLVAIEPGGMLCHDMVSVYEIPPAPAVDDGHAEPDCGAAPMAMAA